VTQTLYFVRHGEVENPRHVVYARLPGFGLSDAGRRQALEAGRRLEAADLDLVVSSPLQRAVETATVLAEASGVEIRLDESLVEWRLGDRWADTVWEELPTQFPGELEAYLDHPDDLEFTDETLVDLAERMGDAAERWSRRGTVAIVSHQDPVQAVRLQMTGRPLTDLHRDKPGHAAVLRLDRSGPGWREVEVWSPDESRESSTIRVEETGI